MPATAIALSGSDPCIRCALGPWEKSVLRLASWQPCFLSVTSVQALSLHCPKNLQA